MKLITKCIVHGYTKLETDPLFPTSRHQLFISIHSHLPHLFCIFVYVVIESPVRSRFLGSRASDRDRDRSSKFPKWRKTEPDLCRPVFSGFFAVTRPVLTGSDHDQVTTSLDRLRPVLWVLSAQQCQHNSIRS